VGAPAQIADGELRYVDLALDVYVTPDGTPQVLDADEFAAIQAELRPDDAARAEQGLEELLALVAAGQLPSRPFGDALTALASHLPGLAPES
jgi:predicted RNA-binding protein associated with RNAse of E/G family